MRKSTLLILSFVILTFGLGKSAAEPLASATPAAPWSRGPSSDAGYFPIAVWLQSPDKAQRYRDAGFNTYVGLWQGPTEQQLAGLKRAGIQVFCEQNETALNPKTAIRKSRFVRKG